ncbi:MAG TPA: hypothetical protein VNF29_08665 [Candidatus Binataceae bacterium]|nr:hypothetical protein [Candidatus Binataceae bacterium]
MLTGIVLGNGASAPTVFGGSSLAAHNFAISISASGVLTGAQPAFTDIFGVATGAQLPGGLANAFHAGAPTIAAEYYSWNTTNSDFEITAAPSGSGTVTSVGLSLPAIFLVTGSPITSSGTLAATLGTEAANDIFAGPASGAAVAPAFRALVGADLPAPSATTLGGTESAAPVTNQWVNSISTAGVPALSQPGFSNLSGTASLTTQVTGILPVANGGRQCGAPSTFAALPASPVNGETCSVTDATACAAGTAVTAGGASTICQVTYNGTSWFPAGGATASGGGTPTGWPLAAWSNEVNRSDAGVLPRVGSEALYGFFVPAQVSAADICYFVATADTTTTDHYSIAVYTKAGALLTSTGVLDGLPTAGVNCTAISTSSGSPSCTASPCTVNPGEYYLGFTGTVATAVLAGAQSIGLTFVSNSSVGTVSGAVPATSFTPPADVWTYGLPLVGFHN